jgi:hypothetical protein
LHTSSISRNTTTNGVHQVQLDQNVAPAGTCTLGSGKYWAIRQTDQDLLKLVIAAQLANKPITLRFDATQTTCTIWYAYVE